MIDLNFPALYRWLKAWRQKIPEQGIPNADLCPIHT